MTITCGFCKNNFEVKKTDKRRAYKFCSFSCFQKYRKIHPPEPNCKCKQCGRMFYRKPSAIINGEGKYCSRQCKHEAQRLGIEIRGESYSDRYLLRQSSQYKSWRLASKKLRGNKCQKCGIKDRTICKCCGNRIYLHVNHVKPFATYPEFRFDPQNSSVLCPKCHLGL